MPMMRNRQPMNDQSAPPLTPEEIQKNAMAAKMQQKASSSKDRVDAEVEKIKAGK